MAKRPTKPMKMPVTTRALLLRVNRKLKAKNQMVVGGRGNIEQHGRFILGDFRTESITPHIDLEKLARELGVMKPWEELYDCGDE